MMCILMVSTEVYLFILDFFYVSFLSPECITSLNHGC